MMKTKPIFYVKSLEKDFATKTIRGRKKVIYQTLDNILRIKTIKPNTKSFGYQRRLACTLLGDNYTKTYRSQGIIFKTEANPDYIAPFDMVLLAQTNNIVVQYYRIENNLDIYYNHKLIPGFESFIFSDPKAMFRNIQKPAVAWGKVNFFREKAGYKKLPKQKYRLVQYNEAIFHKPIKIIPVAIYGYTKEARRIAKKHKLKCFRSAKVFYNEVEKLGIVTE